MTKKASELKRGDVTVLGRVLDPDCVFGTIGGVQKLAILCEGDRWFSCDSGNELVRVETPRVKARDLREQQIVYLQGRERPTRITQIAGGDLDPDGFLVAGFSQGPGMYTGLGPKDWIRVNGNHEFEVVE